MKKCKKKANLIFYSFYVHETPSFSHEYSAASNGAICNFTPKDRSPAFQTMLATVGWNKKIFLKSSMSNKREYHNDDLKPERVQACEESDDNTLMDLQSERMNYGVCRTNSNRKINPEPPDCVQHQGREAEQEDTNLLNAKITKLQEALLLEEEKTQTLEHELCESCRYIRMLNKGSKTLDKIFKYW